MPIQTGISCSASGQNY